MRPPVGLWWRSGAIGEDGDGDGFGGVAVRVPVVVWRAWRVGGNIYRD